MSLKSAAELPLTLGESPLSLRPGFPDFQALSLHLSHLSTYGPVFEIFKPFKSPVELPLYLRPGFRGFQDLSLQSSYPLKARFSRFSSLKSAAELPLTLGVSPLSLRPGF